MDFRQGDRSQPLPIPLAGSLNTRDDPAYHKGQQFGDLRNVERLDGTLTNRSGWEKQHTTAMGWDWCLGGFAYLTRDGTLHNLVVGDDGKVYTGITAPTAATDHSGVTWTNLHMAAFAQWRDDCIITLGATPFNLRYDGGTGTVLAAGLAAPAAPTVAVGAAGTINVNDIQYKVVFYDGVEAWTGPDGAASAAVNAANQKVNLTNIPTCAESDGGGGKTIHRWIFRRDGTNTTWRLVTILADNTTDAYEDDDNDLSGAAALVSYDRIPCCKYCAAGPQDYVAYANDVTNNLPAEVYIAVHDQPEVQYQAVTCGWHGDPITGIIKYANGWYVGTRNGGYYIDAAQPSVAHDQCDVGLVAHRTLAKLPDGTLAFLSEEGPGILRGRDFQFIGDNPRRFVASGSPGWEDAALTKLGNAFAMHVPSKALIRWFFNTDASLDYSGMGIVWDYARNHVWVDDFFCTASWKWPVQGSRENRVLGAFPKGFLGRMDYSSAYDADTHTPGNDGAGSTGSVEGGVTSATSVGGITTIVTDKTDLATTGDGHKGVALYIWEGSGVDDGTTLLVQSNDGDTLTLDGEQPTLPTASTKWWLGGHPFVFDIDGIDAGDAGFVQRFQHTELHMG